MKDGRGLEVINAKIREKKGHKYQNSGMIFFKIEETKDYSFLDYLSGGTEISMIVGIDFTASNGAPDEPSSLHYQGAAPNEYMAALRVVGDVVLPYDKTRMIPAYGFGAKLLTINQTSHCFALNGNEQNPVCAGIDGVLQAYRGAFTWTQLSGPTNFTPIIDRVCQFANASPNGSRYYVLLMITDGSISDFGKTVDELRKAAHAPMSIIIVGVGSANFEQMNELDDDDNSLHIERDIVQFVPFRSYVNVPIEKLAHDTLAEVPGQLVQYMKLHKIAPKPLAQYVPQAVGGYPPTLA